MRLIGEDLALVRAAMDTHLAEVQNHIVTCPDPAWYAKELDSANADKARILALLRRIDRALARELTREFPR